MPRPGSSSQPPENIARMSPTPSDVDPAEHQVTLNLLFEAADYLGRLPANALTRELKAKIDAYLQRPGAAVHKERIATAAEDRNWSERLNAGGALMCDDAGPFARGQVLEYF